ncbi:chorismate mutase [Gammaproteobacteria bacterium AB-CW1]|uniref:chorismate mutase n=1 Tax=Natronospira elongata TaxID=3110268 RepID=A0AAP6JFJ2_9GAMM|nr:chorismate mutase [Gammaproteobacteria bacterium AB-CW1]
MNEEIKALRQVVDIMDHALLDLINRRIRLTGQIGEMKASAGLPCRDRQREENLYLRISLANDGPMSDEAARHLFEILTAESRRIQNQILNKSWDRKGATG